MILAHHNIKFFPSFLTGRWSHVVSWIQIYFPWWRLLLFFDPHVAKFLRALVRNLLERGFNKHVLLTFGKKSFFQSEAFKDFQSHSILSEIVTLFHFKDPCYTCKLKFTAIYNNTTINCNHTYVSLKFMVLTFKMQLLQKVCVSFQIQFSV